MSTAQSDLQSRLSLLEQDISELTHQQIDEHQDAELQQQNEQERLAEVNDEFIIELIPGQPVDRKYDVLVCVLDADMSVDQLEVWVDWSKKDRERDPKATWSFPVISAISKGEGLVLGTMGLEHIRGAALTCQLTVGVFSPSDLGTAIAFVIAYKILYQNRTLEQAYAELYHDKLRSFTEEKGTSPMKDLNMYFNRVMTMELRSSLAAFELKAERIRAILSPLSVKSFYAFQDLCGKRRGLDRREVNGGDLMRPGTLEEAVEVTELATTHRVGGQKVRMDSSASEAPRTSSSVYSSDDEQPKGSMQTSRQVSSAPSNLVHRRVYHREHPKSIGIHHRTSQPIETNPTHSSTATRSTPPPSKMTSLIRDLSGGPSPSPPPKYQSSSRQSSIAPTIATSEQIRTLPQHKVQKAKYFVRGANGLPSQSQGQPMVSHQQPTPLPLHQIHRGLEDSHNDLRHDYRRGSVTYRTNTGVSRSSFTTLPFNGSGGMNHIPPSLGAMTSRTSYNPSPLAVNRMSVASRGPPIPKAPTFHRRSASATMTGPSITADERTHSYSLSRRGSVTSRVSSYNTPIGAMPSGFLHAARDPLNSTGPMPRKQQAPKVPSGMYDKPFAGPNVDHSEEPPIASIPRWGPMKIKGPFPWKKNTDWGCFKDDPLWCRNET